MGDEISISDDRLKALWIGPRLEIISALDLYAASLQGIKIEERSSYEYLDDYYKSEQGQQGLRELKLAVQVAKNALLSVNAKPLIEAHKKTAIEIHMARLEGREDLDDLYTKDAHIVGELKGILGEEMTREGVASNVASTVESLL